MNDLSGTYRTDSAAQEPLLVAPPDAPLAMPVQRLEHPPRPLLSGFVAAFRPAWQRLRGA